MVFPAFLLLAAGWVHAETPAPAAPEGSPGTEEGLREDSPLPSPDDGNGSATAFSVQTEFEIYGIDDPELTQELWTLAGREGEPDPGRYQILMHGDSLKTIRLLREGTQVGNLRGEALEELGVRLRSSVAAGSGTMTRSVGARLWRNFWNPNAPLDPFQWGTGLELETRAAAGVFRNTNPQLEYHYSAVFAQRPEPWLHIEVGGHLSRHGGGLHRNLYNPFDTASNWDGWDVRHPWWHVALGVPGIKWEIAQAGRPYARFYWLDPEAGTGTYKLGRERTGNPVIDDGTREYEDGAVMRNWREGGARQPDRGNLEHALHVKLGVVHYSAYFDRDVYRAPVHQLLFDELSAPFGQWGFGFVATKRAAHTRLRLDLLPWRAAFGPVLGNTSMRIFFLRLDAAYRDPQTFHIGLGASMLLDSPHLRPGDHTR